MKTYTMTIEKEGVKLKIFETNNAEDMMKAYELMDEIRMTAKDYFEISVKVKHNDG